MYTQCRTGGLPTRRPYELEEPGSFLGRNQAPFLMIGSSYTPSLKVVITAMGVPRSTYVVRVPALTRLRQIVRGVHPTVAAH